MGALGFKKHSNLLFPLSSNVSRYAIGFELYLNVDWDTFFKCFTNYSAVKRNVPSLFTFIVVGLLFLSLFIILCGFDILIMVCTAVSYRLASRFQADSYKFIPVIAISVLFNVFIKFSKTDFNSYTENLNFLVQSNSRFLYRTPITYFTTIHILSKNFQSKTIKMDLWTEKMLWN